MKRNIISESELVMQLYANGISKKDICTILSLTPKQVWRRIKMVKETL
jgi:DNA-binding CsgD family transcriptional regulator